VVRGSDSEKHLLKVNDLPCSAGDIVTIYTGGGGGYGSPLERDPERVRLDVMAGYVTREGAERDYGVVLGDGLRVNDGATARLREEMEGTSS
jgi:N-methylhydantoinase B